MKLKLTYSALHLAAVTLLLGASLPSCSNSEADIDSASGEVKTPLSISAVIQSGTEARKADYDATAFSAGDAIGVFILSSDFSGGYTDISYYDYNVKATYDGESWTLSKDIYLEDESACVVAYYPYDSSFGNKLPSESSPYSIYIAPYGYSSGQTNALSSNTNSDEVIYESDDTADYNAQTDVLYSSAVTVNNSSPTASLTFSHALSRLTVNVILSGQIETATLSSVSLTNDDLPGYISLGISEGEFSLSDTDKYSTMTKSFDATLSKESAYTLDFLISPYSPNTLYAAFVIDGETYTINLTSASGWQSGYQYTYNITANRLEDIFLEVTSSAVINAWGDKGTVDEIDVEYYVDDSGTVYGYEAVDLGLSVRWAAVNVGAESPEDYGNYYAWGETSTKSTYTKSNCVTYGIEMDDISGNIEYDAATANWGGPWRMPTYDEAKELIDKCTWKWTTQNGVKGDLVTGGNGNSIFLPAAACYDGYRRENLGYSVYIWTSKPGEGTYYDTEIAYRLNATQTGQALSNLLRFYGSSIRPVTE